MQNLNSYKAIHTVNALTINRMYYMCRYSKTDICQYIIFAALRDHCPSYLQWMIISPGLLNLMVTLPAGYLIQPVLHFQSKPEWPLKRGQSNMSCRLDALGNCPHGQLQPFINLEHHEDCCRGSQNCYWPFKTLHAYYCDNTYTSFFQMKLNYVQLKSAM